MGQIIAMGHTIHVSFLDRDIELPEPTLLMGLALLPVVVVFYQLSKILYRLWFHPLSHIPGPTMAKITYLTEFYYNFIQDGRYFHKFEKWHEKYGPIIRITPDEVHLMSMDTYDKIYHQGSRYTKDPEFYLRFTGDAVNSFAMINPHDSKARRAVVNPIFGRKRVVELEPIVKTHVRKLTNLVQNSKESPEPFNIHSALRSFAIDIISAYTFGESYNFLDDKKIATEFQGHLRVFNKAIWMFRLLPIPLIYRLINLPPKIANAMDPGSAMVNNFMAQFYRTINKVKQQGKSGGTNRTIFHEFLWPDLEESEFKGKPPAMLSDKDMAGEALGYIFAGAESTGNSMEVILLGILEDRERYQKLKGILYEAFPGGLEQMTWPALERIPYLTACIKEGMRIACPLPARLPRIVQEPNIEFFGKKVPAGSIISQSAHFIMMNPEVFPEPKEFKPERWLVPDAHKLEKYWMPFGKGPRMCIGNNLAMSEIYLAIASIVRLSENIEISKNTTFKSTEELVYVDFLAGHPPEGTVGLHINLE